MNLSDGWAPGRWWRVTYGTDGERRLWCETSDEQEAREHLAKLERLPFGVDIRLERLWERHATEWRSA